MDVREMVDELKARIEKVAARFHPDCFESVVMQILEAHQDDPYVCAACNELRGAPKGQVFVATDGSHP